MSAVAEMRVSSPPLGERLRHWRRRLIANPAFQRWAASFPLTRRVADRRARALFDLCAGFVYSQILVACVRLGLFARLAERPRSSRELSAEIGLTAEATERLLRAAVALKLLETTNDRRFALADLGAAMIGNPAIAAFVEHHALLYDDLRDPVALLKGETSPSLSRFWPYAARRPGDPPPAGANAEHDPAYARYSELMSRSQAMIAEDVLDAFPPGSARSWLDVGGGEGAFVSALAKHAPQLDLMLFDLPPVAARARAMLENRGLSSRVRVVEGDFLCDPLPQGVEIVSLVRVLHDHDDESARLLLRRAYAALVPGGRLLIAEPMAATRGAEPIGDAYFGFYLLAMGRGRARSTGEIRSLLIGAGFTTATSPRTRRPLLTSVVTAHRV
jgi:demethylspheroidene O-methyltransferase